MSFFWGPPRWGFCFWFPLHKTRQTHLLWLVNWSVSQVSGHSFEALVRNSGQHQWMVWGVKWVAMPQSSNGVFLFSVSFSFFACCFKVNNKMSRFFSPSPLDIWENRIHTSVDVSHLSGYPSLLKELPAESSHFYNSAVVLRALSLHSNPPNLQLKSEWSSPFGVSFPQPLTWSPW